MSDYRPINCDFQDQLEAWATLQQPCHILYRGEADETAEVHDRIVDIYTTEQAEFLKLSNGQEIRLDQLVSVNNEPVQFAGE